MKIVRQAVNQVMEEIAMREKWDVKSELKRNSFVLVWNKDKQVTAFDTLLESELTEKLHGREMFELRILSENENKETLRLLMEEMAESRKQKFEKGIPVIVKTTLELVLADNHCSLDNIRMIHNIAKEVFQDENGYELDFSDYLVFDFSSQESFETISSEWLNDLEAFYHKHNIIPYIFTEELLKKKETRYKKSIKTIASIIVMNAVSEQSIDIHRSEKTTWRCAAYIEDDKLRYYVTSLFLKFMNRQNEHRMSEYEFIGQIENFLNDGITIEPGIIVEEMKRMPIFLENILPNCKKPFLFFKKPEQLEIGALIRMLYGTDNPVRGYVDLNYENMHKAGLEETLWEKFQMWDLGTRNDVETYLENVLLVMSEERKKKKRTLGEELQDKKNTKIMLGNNMGRDSKECAERLLEKLTSIFRLMAELEDIEREIIALEILYEKIKTSEFKQKLQKIKENQNVIIQSLEDVEYESNIYINCDNLLKELYQSVGYWSRETIEEDIRKQITDFLKASTKKIQEWQRAVANDIFRDFLENIWKRKNMPDSIHEVDFWAVRSDRLRPPITEWEYVSINRQFFENEEYAKNILYEKYPNAKLEKTTRQNILSLEYMNIRDMYQMELLASRTENGEILNNGNN